MRHRQPCLHPIFFDTLRPEAIGSTFLAWSRGALARCVRKANSLALVVKTLGTVTAASGRSRHAGCVQTHGVLARCVSSSGVSPLRLVRLVYSDAVDAIFFPVIRRLFASAALLCA